MSAILAASPPTRSSSIPVRCCVRRWPTPRGSISMPMAQATAWWRGLLPTIAWCWSNERIVNLHAPGAARRDRALSVDGAVLPGAVRLCPEDQPVANRDRATALYADIRWERGMAGDQRGIRRAVAG